jgi:hypothetical protein
VSLLRVYLETSFISYLSAALQGRDSSDVHAQHRQDVSALWWEKHRSDFELFISDTVIQECAVGHPDAVRSRLQVLTDLNILPEISEIMELAHRLVEPNGPLPRKAGADATHIAFASVYECNYLLTWNFKHIANALLQPVLYKIVQSYGYQQPILCTPEELLAGYRDL